ncbi:MAG: tRNA (adenosine(37)-N6)-threonylcarbamoyltransferase complex ATPase subunit type 1 TsaE [Phycisphaerae bacterium]
MSSALEFKSRSPQQTLDAGRVLGETLRGGEVVELCGPLGAGKTQLAKGLALGLGVPDDEPVVSPSFVLVRAYAGRLTFYHCDAYRLRTVDELLALGLEEMLDEHNSVIAIEWADRFPGVLAADAIRVDLWHEDDLSRRVRISSRSDTLAPQLARRLEESGCGVGRSPGAP